MKKFTEAQTKVLEEMAADLIAAGEFIQNNLDQGIRFMPGDVQWELGQAKKRLTRFKNIMNIK